MSFNASAFSTGYFYTKRILNINEKIPKFMQLFHTLNHVCFFIYSFQLLIKNINLSLSKRGIIFTFYGVDQIHILRLKGRFNFSLLVILCLGNFGNHANFLTSGFWGIYTFWDLENPKNRKLAWCPDVRSLVSMLVRMLVSQFVRMVDS